MTNEKSMKFSSDDQEVEKRGLGYDRQAVARTDHE